MRHSSNTYANSYTYENDKPPQPSGRGRQPSLRPLPQPVLVHCYTDACQTKTLNYVASRCYTFVHGLQIFISEVT